MKIDLERLLGASSRLLVRTQRSYVIHIPYSDSQQHGILRSWRELVTNYAPVRTLHLSNLLTAHPDVKTAFASSAFRAAAPKLWNSLPLFVKSSCSYDVFKRRLKSYLFALVFT